MARIKHVSIRGVRREPPDYRKAGRALLELVAAQAEVEAQAEHERKKANRRKPEQRRGA